MATINLPSLAHTAGFPSQWTDTINPVLEGLIVGETPAVVTQDLPMAASLTLTTAYIPVGYSGGYLVPAAAAALAGTFSGVGTAADTITIGGVVYTLVAAATTTAGDVEIGASAALTAANLVAAINGDAGSGTVYGSATVPNPYVTAAAVGAIVTLTAKQPGAVGNAIAVSEAGTGFSFAGGATTLAGGIQAIGITLYPITTVAASNPGVPILRAGCLAKHMIAWPASYTTDAQKLNAFAGAPTPTNIVVREVYFGATVSAP